MNTAKKRVIFLDSDKCNFLKHIKLVKFNQNTLLNVNAENEKIIFWFKIFKFYPKMWILKTEKNKDHIRNPIKILIGNNPRGNGHLLLKLKGSIFLNKIFYSL
jgi:hypothetical protein